MPQFKTWLVCQVCGRAVPRENSVGWLAQPHKNRPGIEVVRCPEHWSEWALRHTVEGRTKKNRAAMQVALAMPIPPIPPHVQPFPTKDREE